MLPLFDDNPHRRTPWVVGLIIVACTAVWLHELSLPGESAVRRFVSTWALIPAHLRAGARQPTWLTPLTSMFLHGSWVHLIGNCWFFWVFGNNIEDRLGHVRFVLFYALCGLGAAAAQTAVDPGSTIPMLGASGAISGVLGAYMRFFPKTPVYTFTFLWFAPIVPVPAFVFILIWFGLQIWQGLGSLAAAHVGGGVAWWAHIGGFVTGLLLARIMRRRA